MNFGEVQFIDFFLVRLVFEVQLVGFCVLLCFFVFVNTSPLFLVAKGRELLVCRGGIRCVCEVLRQS